MNKVVVARLGRAVGLKGFLKLHNLSDFSEQFKKKASFYTEDERILSIKEVNKTRSLVLFDGYESLEMAQILRNEFLYQSIEASRKNCKLKEGEYFYFDIMACELFEGDLYLGIVVDILQTSASHLLLIKTDEKLVQKGLAKEFYLPFKPHITKVELECKRLFAQKALWLLESL